MGLLEALKKQEKLLQGMVLGGLLVAGAEHLDHQTNLKKLPFPKKRSDLQITVKNQKPLEKHPLINTSQQQ